MLSDTYSHFFFSIHVIVFVGMCIWSLHVLMFGESALFIMRSKQIR